MADHAQPKERKKRVAPSVDGGKASRVSKAAGSIGSESMRVEQRSGSGPGTSATKQRASAGNVQNGPKRGKSGGGSKQKPQASRKGPSANRPAPGAPAPQPDRKS